MLSSILELKLIIVLFESAYPYMKAIDMEIRFPFNQQLVFKYTSHQF
jgi:hypothetical protein